ncbi:MAG: glycosyltransferase family 2 protein [Bacteroidales bacterium]
MAPSPFLSLVIPLYNEAENITQLVKEVCAVLEGTKTSWELILVDDGSTDQSFEMIRQLHAENSAIRGYSLSRNFGHQVALLAGLEKAKGEVIITMDADLQHPPSVIPELIEKYNEGFQLVNTRRIDKGDIGWFKKGTSRFFYRFINSMAEVHIAEASSDFRLMNRRVLDAFLQFRERARFTRGLVSWMGFRQTFVNYEAPARFAGKSKYTLRKMLYFALDGITSFSTKPLRISGYVGVLVFISGLLYSIYALVQFAHGRTVPGWTSLLITVLIIGGIQLLALGILGEYMARIFNEAKARPIYFIKDETA